jgi:hypothetical protein
MPTTSYPDDIVDCSSANITLLESTKWFVVMHKSEWMSKCQPSSLASTCQWWRQKESFKSSISILSIDFCSLAIETWDCNDFIKPIGAVMRTHYCFPYRFKQ